ncbi:MAG: hypothetical protein IIC00_12390 [Planctomycetes bacterium]|nr:hypothetical protein [Planctomycetota bacterium]
MSKRLIYLMMFVLALSSTANAAVYLWNGSAADGLWETPANWTVTDSTWTWPNEENAADPNMMKYTNADTIAIDILNGDAVTSARSLAIHGAADGSTTGVLTLNNGSSLTVTGRLATATYQMGRGQIDILGGSTVTILGDGADLTVADDTNNWGTLNIVDSTVDISDDLRIDAGEGYVNISGSSIVNADDFVIADDATGVSYVDISGTAVINLADDFRIDQGIGIVNIGGDAVINMGDDCYIPDQADGVGTMTLTGNSVFNVGDDMTIADDAGTVGHVIITGNATLNVPDELYLADDPTAFATLDINGTATVNIGDDLNVGEDGPGICNIGENAIVNVADDIYVGHNAAKGVFTSYMTISGNATVNCDDFLVPNNSGLTGYLEISGNPTITVADDFNMNDDSGDLPTFSQVIMNGGTVIIGDQTTIGDDGVGGAVFIMNGGSWYSDDDIFVGEHLESIASLTINGGSMITGDNLKMGNNDGDPSLGQSRIFINGGLLQSEGFSEIRILDSKIIYTGGLFRIAEISVAEMEQMITDGIIVADGVHTILRQGAYTELNSVSPLVPQGPTPADGAEGVPLGTSVSWRSGDTAATNDVYFGTTNPPAFAASVEAGTYYPGAVEPGTTYYWQVDAVEEDGTTKHSSEVWSFTTTTETSNAVVDIRIATGSDDAEEDVGGSASFAIDLTSSDLEFMYDNDPNDPNDEQVVGLRFVGVGIPAGAVITSASVQFDADDIDNDRHIGDTYALIEGELNPNPDTFEDTLNNITARPRTTAIVAWAPAQWMETHLQSPDEATSDISSIIQEIVDQDGWAAGNALVLILSQDPANPSVGLREAESFNGAGDNTVRRPRLHIEAIVSVATQPSPTNGAEGVPLDTTFGWWPGVNAASHDVYFDTSPMTPLPTPPYLVDVDSHSLPWVVANGTITFDGQIFNDGGDPDFISAGASGNSLDVPDLRNWAKLSFDFDVDSVEFIYGGNAGNITVQAKDNAGAIIGSLSQADTSDGQPAGPVTFSGSGIRSLDWKDTSSTKKFAALDNIVLTAVPPALLGRTTQVSIDPGVLTPSTTYYWQVDTIEADGTKRVGAVWSFTTVPGEATQPDPADKAVGVALDKIVSWKSGATVATHDVYFGTTNPPPFIGNQTESSFAGTLDFDTTYYWQVDEIEADGITVYTGDIWSFSTVLDIPITNPNLVGWWKLDDDGPDIAIDYSGYHNYGFYNGVPQFAAGNDGDALDLDGNVHVVLGDMNFGDATDFSVAIWINTTGWQDDAAIISNKDWNSGGNTGWVIAGEAGGSGSWQWNWNVSGGSRADYDPPGPTLSNGEWNHLCVTHDRDGMAKFYFNGLFQDERDISGSTGSIDSGYPTVIGTDGAEGAVWKAWFVGLLDDARIYNIALSEAEVREIVGLKEAWSPDPADGTIEVQKTVTLSWTPGGTAASHDVYLSADEQAVIDGTAPVTTVTEASYSPADLEKGVTYYWRVDAVEADGTTHTGDVWSFTVTTLGR